MNYQRSYNACTCLGVLVGLIAGVVSGILFFNGIIAGAITAIWIAFGLAVLALILLVVGIFFARDRSSCSALTRCLCANTGCLLAGIIGTIVLSIILLSTLSVVISLVGAILFGIGTFFFTLMIMSLIVFICCIVSNLCFNENR